MIVRLVRSAAVLLLLGVALAAACREPQQGLPDPATLAETSWQQYVDEPTAITYVAFIAANRKAALDHAHPHDTLGVRYQVRALEAQAESAERNEDLVLAQDVIARVDDIDSDELIEVFEEVLPGATERLRAARERVRPMLELPIEQDGGGADDAGANDREE